MEKCSIEVKTEYADLVTASQAAAKAAEGYLGMGRIDYTRFDNETLDALVAGPGYVTEPATVEPHHIGTTTSDFAYASNNFHLLFNDYWGERRRKFGFYQRFEILFPAFAGALRAQYREYVTRCLELDPAADRIESAMNESLRSAYGIMSLLIDQKDTYDNGQQVRNIGATRILQG